MAALRAVVLLVHLPGMILELVALPGDVGALLMAATVTVLVESRDVVEEEAGDHTAGDLDLAVGTLAGPGIVSE